MLCLGKFTILLYIHTVIYLLVNDNENYICQGNALFMTLFLTDINTMEMDVWQSYSVLLAQETIINIQIHLPTMLTPENSRRFLASDSPIWPSTKPYSPTRKIIFIKLSNMTVLVELQVSIIIDFTSFLF